MATAALSESPPPRHTHAGSPSDGCVPVLAAEDPQGQPPAADGASAATLSESNVWPASVGAEGQVGVTGDWRAGVSADEASVALGEGADGHS